MSLTAAWLSLSAWPQQYCAWLCMGKTIRIIRRDRFHHFRWKKPNCIQRLPQKQLLTSKERIVLHEADAIESKIVPAIFLLRITAASVFVSASFFRKRLLNQVTVQIWFMARTPPLFRWMSFCKEMARDNTIKGTLTVLRVSTHKESPPSWIDSQFSNKLGCEE